MAPRLAKAKKAADVKVVESEAPKKGRGKAKQVEVAEEQLSDPEVVEDAVPEKKKRGRKPAETNSQEDVTEATEHKESAAKRGKKKTPDVNGDNAEFPDSKEEAEPADENADTNGNAELLSNGKGKKKPAKKESEKSEKPTRGKKARQGTPEKENEVIAEKAKPTAKGRGRKPKTDKETEEKAETTDDVKTEPATKGRKKAPTKAIPEVQEDKTEDDTKHDEVAPKGKRKTPAKPSEQQEDKNSDEPKNEEPLAKGKKKAAKPDSDLQSVNAPNDEPIAKGRKKTAAKPDLAPEPQEDKIEEVQHEDGDNKPEEKKQAKGRKPPTKKAQTKADTDEIADGEPAGKKKKVAKKEDKGKGDIKDEEPVEDESSEAKAKGKKGLKKGDEIEEPEEEVEDTGEPNNKRRRKVEEKAPAKEPVKNKSSTDYENLDFSNTSINSQGKEWNFKIASWNVDGLRACLKKGGFDYIRYEKPDILCLQEVKCSKEKLPEEAANLPGYHAYWLCSDKDGYAGVGIYTTKLAISVQYGLQNKELDSEGRIITAEYEQFYLICTYVPNAGKKLITLDKRLQWNEEFRKHVKELDKKKPVIICGDMNVAHNEIDLKNPKTNRKNAGFTDEERSGMTELLSDGFVDTYRHLNPDETGAYTFWTYMMNSRAKNTGWRLDYFIVSERLMPSICDSVIRDQVYGSDHCPISLLLHLTSAEQPKE